MSGFIEVSGPASLSELVSTLTRGAVAETPGDRCYLPGMGDDEVLAQYDEVDADTWPYMVSVDADDEAARVRAVVDLLRPTGWAFRAFVEDDQLIAEAKP